MGMAGFHIHSFLVNGNVFHHATGNEPNSIMPTGSAFLSEGSPRAWSRPCLAEPLLKAAELLRSH